MKRKWKWMILMALIIMSAVVFRMNRGPRTIEEAITVDPIIMIHEEKTEKGSIVFYTQPEGDSLHTHFFKRSIMGWKYVYGGVKGDAKFGAKRWGVTSGYFPNIENTPFPMYFGVIGNTDIQKVKVIEKKRGIEREAKIIPWNHEARLWMLYMNGFEGSEFEIVGLAGDGKELIRRRDNIYPRSAEEEPIELK